MAPKIEGQNNNYKYWHQSAKKKVRQDIFSAAAGRNNFLTGKKLFF